jgi:hypothetical protein
VLSSALYFVVDQLFLWTSSLWKNSDDTQQKKKIVRKMQ